MIIEDETMRTELNRLADGHTTVDETMQTVKSYADARAKTTASEISGAVVMIAMFALVAYITWLIVGALT